MAKQLMKGNEAVALGAILGGCTHFFGYPITPQNEIPEYLARELPKAGGTFLQAESELAAINMIYGAAAAGAYPMTSSSSPGIALMQEGLSILAAAELPCVIVNVQRGGPGIGGIQPSQADYYQMTRGGGNGDYSIIVLAPATVQESFQMMLKAFELAVRYQTPVFMISDGLLGQMMEPVDIASDIPEKLPLRAEAVQGHGGKRSPYTVKTLALDPERLEEINTNLQDKYSEIEKSEATFEKYHLEDAHLLFCGYGSAGRIAQNAVDLLRKDNIKTGLIRPTTIWPFPKQAFTDVPQSCKHILAVEMNCGQMIDDVRLAVDGAIPVSHYGRCGGVIPTPEEFAEQARHLLK